MTARLPCGNFAGMKIQFLFETRGRSVAEVAAAAEVNPATAWKWKSGKQNPDWERICKLHARGFITDDDLRAAGLAIPRVG